MAPFPPSILTVSADASIIIPYILLAMGFAFTSLEHWMVFNGLIDYNAFPVLRPFCIKYLCGWLCWEIHLSWQSLTHALWKSCTISWRTWIGFFSCTFVVCTSFCLPLPGMTPSEMSLNPRQLTSELTQNHFDTLSFKQPPMITFKQTPNLRSILYHAKMPPTKQIKWKSTGIKPCNKPCKFCFCNQTS